MATNKNFFIKIDEFIFQKIDVLKSDSSFQKMGEYFSALEENQQKIMAQVLTFCLIILPYVFVIVLWWGNHSIKQKIEIKNQILEQIATLNGNKDTLNTISSSYVAPASMTNQSELEAKIVNMLSTSGIDQNKVHVTGFNLLTSTSTLSKIEAQLDFKNFGTRDFSTFMQSLIDQEKFKIMKIDLTKDKNSNLLQGQVTLLHIGKTLNYQ